jgi:hypothetical protein
MQPFFEDANDELTILHVEREILSAVKQDCDVVFIEIPYFSPMDEQGLAPTHRRLKELGKGYKRSHTVMKMMFPRGRFEGANNIIRGSTYRQYQTKQFRVCGVCTGGWLRNEDGTIKYDERTNSPEHTGCVFDIVLGLSKLLPEAQIEVVQDACRDSRPAAKETNWDDFRTLPNVTVLIADSGAQAA